MNIVSAQIKAGVDLLVYRCMADVSYEKGIIWTKTYTSSKTQAVKGMLLIK